MAQPTHLNHNLPGDKKYADLGGPFLYRNQDRDGEKASYSLETPYGFTLDLDFLKYVDDIESGQTLRKIPLNRKAKGPKQALDFSRSQTGGWTSTESLSSTTSEDGKPVFSPRPRIWASSSEPASKQASLPMSPAPIIHLLPPPCPKSLLRNTQVEKTLLETSKRLEREQLDILEAGTATTTTKTPRSPSKVASSPSFSQNLSPSCIQLTGESQVDLSLPHVKMSPSNSGRSTPATGVTPGHLYHVRDQMAAALKQLKELEEQVKTIPALEMKICRLKKEREQLVAGLWEKSQAGDAFTFDFPPRSPSEEAAANPSLEDSREADKPSKERMSKIAELKKLTEKLSASEKTTKANKGAGPLSRAEEDTHRSVGVGEEIDMGEAVFYYRCQRPCQEVAVGWQTETKDAEVWVMESLLGVSAETEQEIGLLQETVQHQQEVISMLEEHLKEAAEELEELRVAVCSRMPKHLVSKETMAQPETVEVSLEAVPATQSQAVGDHIEMTDKSVFCSPQVACVGVGCHLEQEDLLSVKRSQATQMDLMGESEVPEQSHDSAVAEPDQQGDAPVPKDEEVSNRTVTEECEVPPFETDIVGVDPELHLQIAATEEETAQGASDHRSTGRTETGVLKSIMKKRDGDSKAEAGSGKKSLQFVGLLNGEYESTSSEEEEEEEDQSPEKGSPLTSDSEVAVSTDTSDEEVIASLRDSDSESPLPVAAAQDETQQCCDREKVAEEDATLEVKEKFELSPQMREACLVVKSHLGHGGGGAKSREVVTSTSLILQEWFRVSSQKSSQASQVAEHLLAFAEISPVILTHVVNLSDGNGNTALHYSVSHSNFDIVQLLLNTGVCNVNHQNKAGYTALMLAALASVEQEEDMAVVRRLFAQGNVNAKASQAGQTALMLAVSHGRQEMVEALLVCGADINLQDEEGSTALMCACEHGRAGTVRLLLSQSSCDVSIVDNDGNDAVSIALEAGHQDIATMISTHLTKSATQSPDQNGKKSPRKQL
ncbi:KN motif and ankyrin repeat domain-containing protein 1-like isoform X2 [Sphaerodactylus townsendi]|uniref:KN motif and ankyrin repeat domain-containing protein 1-like isoform X2 n=1 Tax=Sphaerodactylus townsendi TaxID=933632 RepID=UPI00202651B4|nr:KN motif and ankyrin repeat domain-containing protein 1-like isoform X2 [Sphaerodactylus townsendi]